VDSVLDSGAVRPGFESLPRRCRVTALGKLFEPIVPLFTNRQIGSSPLRIAGVTAGLAEGNGSLALVYDSRHLQAEPGSAPEPYARQSSMDYRYLVIKRFPGINKCSHVRVWDSEQEIRPQKS